LILSDKKTIRSRTVNTEIDLIAEVSGIADLMSVFSAFLIVDFFTPKMLQSKLIRHLGKIKLTQRPNKFIDAAANLPDNADKKLLVEIINEVSTRGILHLNWWLIFVAAYLPRSCLTKRTNRVLELANQSIKRMNGYLDVRRIVDS
jgi:hypothetical protein